MGEKAFPMELKAASEYITRADEEISLGWISA